MGNNPDKRKYEDLPRRDWSENDVRDLRELNLDDLYSWLPSIMHAESLSGPWRVQLALDLLEHEQARSHRARVWDCLAICARVAPLSSFQDAACLAWSLIDLSANDDASNAELCSIQDFLSDLRTFAYDASSDSAEIRTHSFTASRFEVFKVFRAMCSYNDIGTAGQLAVTLAAEMDFVLRESSINGISIIYSRPDCDPSSLGSLRTAFARTLRQHECDPHWYVRKANDNALFFQEQFNQEYPPSETPPVDES
ncbi:hypothetical protein DTL42_13810 [Bremerella cremea]|uniref:Uncharacterized protein n=1 Tax=Bremerella cremea TaxID=1031537 RepID=A0A368KQB5_9BACT|nr:hypothetical protein DTL42_13810 [Bremerella cremea]